MKKQVEDFGMLIIIFSIIVTIDKQWVHIRMEQAKMPFLEYFHHNVLPIRGTFLKTFMGIHLWKYHNITKESGKKLIIMHSMKWNYSFLFPEVVQYIENLPCDI